MDFWKIIASSTRTPLSISDACERLGSVLGDLSEPEVLEFCTEFDRKMDEAYTWELWGMAYLVNGGCGDDSFMDFRGSLIASGKDVFENATSHAESLLALGEDHLSEMFEEGFIYCGPTRYEQMTGKRPETDVVRKESPSGQQWEESAQSLRKRFPKAWEVYGWEESRGPEAVTKKKPWWKFW